jgi:small-conductance mechanosensitive channel
MLVLSAPARENLSLGSRAAMVFVIAWLVVRWIRVMAIAVELQMARRGISDGASIVRIGRAAAIGIVWLLGLAAALQIFGLDLSTVIAGLGIGTAAIALASQQTLSNLFGGASVVADQVLNVGDTCKIDGNIEVRATFRTRDMPTYRAAIQRINLDCMRIVARHGSGFAFPSRTVYMAQDAGVGTR